MTRYGPSREYIKPKPDLLFLINNTHLMCGILGSVNMVLKTEDLDRIKHRGPDSSGAAAFTINDNTIFFQHRRLSIVDLSENGHQPMFTSDSMACIIYNGEVYNHEVLKRKMAEVQFKGHSDTETILNYFGKFEITESLADLNGIFAFAYLDIEKEHLYLARDRFGVKPLYYWFQENQLFFGSELRPLKSRLNPAINTNALLNSLRMRYSPAPSTIFQDIYKVEPGQLLVFNLQSKITLEKFYFVKRPQKLGFRRDEYKKLIYEYGELFEKAVERQLMSDVEVGILLSGGVDSALVAAIAKKHSNLPVKSFTIGFKEKQDNIDEIEYARRTADVIGLNHLSTEIDFSDFLNSIEKIVNIVEEPIGTTSIIPMYYLSKLASSKVKVVLSGQGADEPLGGYNKYKALPWVQHSRKFKSFMQLTRSLQSMYNSHENLRRLASSMQSANDIDSLIELNAISSIQQVVNLTLPGNRRIHADALLVEQKFFNELWTKRLPDHAQIMDLFLYYDMRTSLADDLLLYTDKITMHFSLECRVPILDNELIAFIESLDTRYKYSFKKGKIIHKDFAREYLPAEIIERKKLGFKSPTETWFRENKRVIEKLFHDNKTFSTYFDLKAVSNLLALHQNGRNLEKQIFLLLSIQFLLKNS